MRKDDRQRLIEYRNELIDSYNKLDKVISEHNLNFDDGWDIMSQTASDDYDINSPKDVWAQIYNTAMKSITAHTPKDIKRDDNVSWVIVFKKMYHFVEFSDQNGLGKMQYGEFEISFDNLADLAGTWLNDYKSLEHQIMKSIHSFLNSNEYECELREKTPLDEGVYDQHKRTENTMPHIFKGLQRKLDQKVQEILNWRSGLESLNFDGGMYWLEIYEKDAPEFFNFLKENDDLYVITSRQGTKFVRLDFEDIISETSPYYDHGLDVAMQKEVIEACENFLLYNDIEVVMNSSSSVS